MKNKEQRYYPVRNADNPFKVDLIPVSEEVYQSIYPEIERTRKRMQRNGNCVCPKSKLWACDADCSVCPYSACGNTVSYDTPLDDAEGLTLGDTLVSDEPSPEAIAINTALLEALYEELDRLDPDGRRICQFIMEGKTEREMAADLGKRQSTINYQKNRVLDLLREALKDFI